MNYAIVSCHVERPLDDRIWEAFERLLERRPSGFVVTPFVRPPADGEDEAVWLARVRRIAELAPLGHHTHWGGVEQARPKSVDASLLVREQAKWLRTNGLSPKYFCGGGWYFDVPLAQTLADLDYVDCSATTFRQSYLDDDAPRLQLATPHRLRLPSGATLLELPATHSLGMLGRSLLRLRGPVHMHFHDWELVSPKRATALALVLKMLRLQRRPLTIDELAQSAGNAPEFEVAGATIGP